MECSFSNAEHSYLVTILVSSIFTKKGCQICTYRVQDGPLVGSCLWYVAQTVSGCIFRLPKDHRHATEQGILF